MKKIVAAVVPLCFSTFIVGQADAASDPLIKYQITAEEQTACGMDAVEYCAGAYPDGDKMLACMKANRMNLSLRCRPIFEEGMRRRHLN